jgi:hypothetical protein
VYAKIAVGPAALLAVLLVDTATNATLATARLTVPSTGDWVQLNFTLTPVNTTACYLTTTSFPSPPCAVNAEQLCSLCTGALRFQLGTAVTEPLQLDHAVLAPGLWGTLPMAGWRTTRVDAGQALTRTTGTGGAYNNSARGPGLALTTLRLGGSMILADGYRWKRFRGPPWERQPYAGLWYPYTSSSWGIFEFLNLCEAQALAACVVTLNSAEELEDVADFVEYAFGSETSVWGALRARDGHALPYSLSQIWLEIGNEQDHTDPGFISQVVSFAGVLNASLALLGVPPGSLCVCIGATPGTGWPPSSVGAMAVAVSNLTSSTSRLRFFWDFHVGGDNPAADASAATVFIRAVAEQLRILGYAKPC